MSFDEWYTEGRLKSDLLVQHDIGSAQLVNSPESMIGAHQTILRTTTSDKGINIAIFDNLDLRKYYVEIDGQTYPRDGISLYHTGNDYTDQDRD